MMQPYATQNMAVADHGELSYSLVEEIELLEAIYIHELNVQGPRESPTTVSVVLHPSTGDDEHKRFVCLTLVIHLPSKYPSELPSITIKTPRGLSEAHIESILSNLRELSESCLGRPMLYELIEYAKESLTDNNVPSCACAICLCHFQESDEFTKTECYHYFHCGCLARYIEYSLQQEDEREDKTKVECPMCRLPITYNLTQLQSFASKELREEEIVYKPSEEIRKLQKKMASLFEKQKKKGGIIDIEQERNRFLIDITSVRQEETLPESEPDLGTVTDTVKTDSVVDPYTNKAPKRQNGTKEYNAEGKHVRRQKPERREKRDFSKDTRPSRGHRRPAFDRAGNKSEEEKFRQDKQTIEKRHAAADSRPRRTEKKDEGKGAMKSSEEQGRAGAGEKKVSAKSGVELERRTETKDEEKVAIKRSEEHGKDAGENQVKAKPEVKPKRRTEKKDEDIVAVKSFEEQSKHAGEKQVKVKSGVEPDTKTSVADVSEKVASAENVSSKKDNNSSWQNSNGERARSAKKRRGRSGKGRTLVAEKSEVRSGSRDLKEKTTCSGDDGEQQTAKPQPSRKVTSYLKTNACGKADATVNSKQGTSVREDIACKPPPGFETKMVDNRGSEQLRNDPRRPPPGFETHLVRPRPPPGLGSPVEGRTAQSTSQSVIS